MRICLYSAATILAAVAPTWTSAEAAAIGDLQIPASTDQSGPTAPRVDAVAVPRTPTGTYAPPPRAATAATIAQPGEIVVTATRRSSRLSDVPIAITAVTPVQLRNSGATDIRQLTQLAPSLLVSSSSSEAGAAGARIRGIGTVGDNPGLESSVAVFIDGVYRSRPGTALTELGAVDQIEVLRGPQGTLFGRNASAGLINITTARPDTRKFGGYLDGTHGNYDFYRIAGGLTGPIGDSGLSFRLDAVYQKRDGFIKDVVSDRRFNNRNRYLIRGKLLYEPSDRLSVMLIADYTHQNEQCCAATFLRARDATKNADGSLTFQSSAIASLERSLTSAVPGAGQGQIIDDTFARRAAVTPGRSYLSRVNDWGGSAQIDYDLGSAGKLTSITAYRYNKYTSSYDPDYNNLDILAFPSDGARFTRFKTFSQELRLQGSAFSGKLDWLIGGFYSHEDLVVTSNFQYGADYAAYGNGYSALLLGQAVPILGPLFSATGYNNLNGFSSLIAGALGGPAAAAAVGNVVQNAPLIGQENDRFHQRDDNYAIFTHDIFHVTPKFSITLGARYTLDDKQLSETIAGPTGCNAFLGDIQRLDALAATNSPGAGAAAVIGQQILLPLVPVACLINGAVGQYSGVRHERVPTGTAVATYKFDSRFLGYASYARGYKAGGFNLDRANILDLRTGTYQPTDNLSLLQFKPERVDSYEIGAKLHGRRFAINAALFYEAFKSFQLNTFDGTHFFVSDIRGCSHSLDGLDRDQIRGNSACSDYKPGVTTRGLELEAYLYPARDVVFVTGFTLSDAKFAKNLVGTADASGNNSLDPSLSLIPGGRVSNSSKYVVTGSGSWTPPIGDLRGLLYADFRYSSAINSGSDNFPEKIQPGVMVVNARIGIGAANDRWRIEGWVQNAFNVNYYQVAFNAPVQGNPANGSSAQIAPGQTAQNLYAAFLAEPRTFGLTVRTKF